MADKTQKIAEELHRKLKLLAIEEGKTLQEITEEVIRDGFAARNNQGNQGFSRENDEGGSHKDTGD